MALKVFKIAVHGLLKKGNRYLVTKRAESDGYMPGYWDIPGGTIRFGEKTERALQREFFEEAGLRIVPGKILMVYGYKSNPQRHQVQLVFACTCRSGKIRLNPRDHSEYRWVTLEEMGKLKKIAFLKALYKELLSDLK